MVHYTLESQKSTLRLWLAKPPCPCNSGPNDLQSGAMPSTAHNVYSQQSFPCYGNIYIFIYIYIYIHKYIYTYTSVLYIHIYKYVYICIQPIFCRLYMKCVCTHIYIYIYIFFLFSEYSTQAQVKSNRDWRHDALVASFWLDSGHIRQVSGWTQPDVHFHFGSRHPTDCQISGA